MNNVRTQHPNAPLTPEGRRRMVECVLIHHWTIETTAERLKDRCSDWNRSSISSDKESNVSMWEKCEA